MFGKYNKIFGLDHGNGFIKIVRASKRGIEKHRYPSAIAPAEEFRNIDDVGEKQSKIDTYESSKYPNEEYTFGDHVTEANSPYSTNAIGNSRYLLKPYILLNEFVLSKYADDGDEILIVTGSPSSERISEGTEALIKKAFEGKHEVKVNGKTKTFRVTVLVKAQPLGTYFCEYLDNDGNATGKIEKDDYVGIFDIGTFTSDTAGIKGNKVQANDVDTYDRGMDYIYTGIARYINEKLGGKKINNHRLVKPVQDKKSEFKRGMDKVEISEVTKTEIKRSGDFLISQIQSLWKNQDEFTKILITGGGAEVLGEYLKENWNSRITIVEENMYANAIGFYRFGVMAAKHNKV